MLKLFLGVCFPALTLAQGFKTRTDEPARIIPLSADSWTFRPGTVEFLPTAPTIGGVAPQGPGMRIVASSGPVIEKNVDFSEGVIEFDIQPTDSNFATLYFHWQDAMENESFYLRTQWGGGHPDRMEGVQYAPTLKGINCWNLLPHYQGNAAFRQDTWNHIRILVAGRQMLVYVNSDKRPTLTVPRLEGNMTHGSLAFEGQMTVAHLVVRSTPVTGIGWLSGPEGFDPTDNDPRYLRQWLVSQPDTIPPGVDFSNKLMPGKQLTWSPIQAERRGLVNLTRLFGGNIPGPYPDGLPRRIVWLKTTLHADREWDYKLRLGFANDVWVFLNGKMLYLDKNHYDEPSMKTPRGRVSLDNSSLDLPLKAGANELLIGVGNDFFGWGITARLDDREGVKFE
jgi:hypothetical protein